MKFSPFTKKYDFSEEVLREDFPPYLAQAIAQWIINVLERGDLIGNDIYSNTVLDQDLVNELQLHFKTTLAYRWEDFRNKIFADPELTANFLALLLQNLCNGAEAANLESILSKGGSAYAVEKTNKEAGQYADGVYDLMHRVPDIIKQQAAQALSNNDLLHDAWLKCYSRNPNYEKVVSNCSDFLESYLGKMYFPKDPKPQLKKFVHAFEADSSKLSYKGDSIVDPKSMLTSLLKEASNVRGQHTAGKGRKPTKEEAEFTLHVTILIWNMHQR